MRAVIYAPGGKSRGIGHTMRALGLSEEALSRGWQVQLAGSLEGHAYDQACSVPGLELLGDLDESSLPEVASSSDVVHIDAYDTWLDRLDWGETLVSSMADAEFGLRRSHMIVDSSPGAPARARRVRTVSGAHTLLGPDFSILRRRVQQMRGRWVGSGGGRPRVLIVMGGTDSGQLAGETVAALSSLAVDFTVVCAPGTQDALARTWPANALGVLTPVPFLQDLVGEACRHDLVITAAGTTVWELASAGVPMALVCAVGNQADNYASLVEQGAALGLARTASELGDGADVLAPALADRSVRRELSSRASRLVDGHGSWRVISAWENLLDTRRSPRTDAARIKLRRATFDDSAQLLSWRNDQLARNFSRNADIVTRVAHERWLRGVLAAPDRHLLIAEGDEGPRGTLRWDLTEHASFEARWEVSITVAPRYRGEGLAQPMVVAAEGWLRSHVPGPSRALATVHEENAASIRLFQGCGYLPYVPRDPEGFAVWSRSIDRP